ncbi:hypothetical protein D9758_018321 [Tetrapyrgos nigripes]|uniref:Uncharacterized protein n=1 Tax=Tetrapyrgos nigripes TaxID=182062 RepID=A0A8H5F1N1_9AGAR|nr:hypothetical protein D9758_018321 [Tetrapyrgos nigripes]
MGLDEGEGTDAGVKETRKGEAQRVFVDVGEARASVSPSNVGQLSSNGVGKPSSLANGHAGNTALDDRVDFKSLRSLCISVCQSSQSSSSSCANVFDSSLSHRHASHTSKVELPNHLNFAPQHSVHSSLHSRWPMLDNTRYPG